MREAGQMEASVQRDVKRNVGDWQINDSLYYHRLLFMSPASMRLEKFVSIRRDIDGDIEQILW